MIVLRKPLIEESTNTLRIAALIKELNRLIDDLNIAFEQIDKEIREVRGNIDGDEKTNS